MIRFFNKNIIFNLYILSLPFSFAFSFYNGIITFSLMISIFMLLEIIFANKFKISNVLFAYITPALIFIVYVLVNSIINLNFSGQFLNHVISYIVSALLFLIIPLLYFESFKLKYDINEFFSLISFMIFFTCLYAVLQFVFNNFFQINLDDYLHWPSKEVSNSLALGYFRAKGFFAEPGHFALFLECFIPIIFWFFYRSKKIFNSFLKNITFLIIISSFVLTVSAAGFACLSLAFILVLLINFRNLSKYLPTSMTKILLFFVSAFLVFYLTNDYLNLVDVIYTNSLDKLTSSVGSTEDRTNRLVVFYAIVKNMNIIDYIFGHGPNATVLLGYPKNLTMILLYHLLFIELGIIGLFSFLSIIYVFFKKTYLINGKLRFFIQVSLISLLLHYIFIGNYWYPYLWFLGVLIYLVNKLNFDTELLKNE